MAAFVADRPVLDFLATIAERGTTDEEKLEAPCDLADWALESALTTGRPTVSAAQLAAAIDLREAAYRTLGALIDGVPPRPKDRALINAAATRPRPTPQLTASGGVARAGGIDAVLAALACDCVELVAGPDRERLRRCGDATCTRLFVDRSRGGRRRWCDMKGCGDRAKAAAYCGADGMIRRSADRGPRTNCGVQTGRGDVHHDSMTNASRSITDEVASWPGVEAGPGRRGEFAFRVGRREIGHLHGDRAAHFSFPKPVWSELFAEGRVVHHPVFPGKEGPAARAIEDEADVRDVIRLMRLNYERVIARHGVPQD